MLANSSTNLSKETRQESRRGSARSSFRSTSLNLDKNTHEAKFPAAKVRSSVIAPRVNIWRRNSTPKPFALSIFSNWNVGYSPIHDSDSSEYHSVRQSSKESRDSMLKNAHSLPAQSTGGEKNSSCDHHQYESASEASSDFSLELLYKRPRVFENDEDEREAKKFRFSDLHGKPVKKLVEIFTAVEEGEITV